MLEAAVVALEAGEAAALAAFTAGDAPFKDRDLYVFCGGPDGMMTAHGAGAGELKTVEYVWPRPGDSEPLPKASSVTMAGEQMCSVGCYA